MFKKNNPMNRSYSRDEMLLTMWGYNNNSIICDANMVFFLVAQKHVSAKQKVTRLVVLNYWIQLVNECQKEKVVCPSSLPHAHNSPMPVSMYNFLGFGAPHGHVPPSHDIEVLVT